MVVQFFSSVDAINSRLRELRTVFLDFDGTLVDFHDSEKKAFFHFLRKHGVPQENHEALLQAYISINEELWEAYTLKKITMRKVLNERFRALQKLISLPGEALDLDQEFRDLLVTYTALESEEYEALVNLKEQNIKIIIVTNGVDETQKKRIRKIGINPLIDGLITSQSIGVAKPNPQIFHAGLELASSKPRETWMIGDSLHSDISGAKQVGLFTCYVTRSSELQRYDYEDRRLQAPDMVVSRFSDFVKYYVDLEKRSKIKK